MTVGALAKLEANAPDVARALRVFANEHRVRILFRLAASNKELSFAALADGNQICQSSLSQHLMKLRKGGLIGMRRADHNSFYRLADPRALKLAIGLQIILKEAMPRVRLRSRSCLFPADCEVDERKNCIRSRPGCRHLCHRALRHDRHTLSQDSAPLKNFCDMSALDVGQFRMPQRADTTKNLLANRRSSSPEPASIPAAPDGIPEINSNTEPDHVRHHWR